MIEMESQAYGKSSKFERCVFKGLIKNAGAECQNGVCPQFPVSANYKFPESSNGQESEREWLMRLIKFHGLTLDDCEAYKSHSR